MGTKYRHRTPVQPADAMQFDGSEESADAVIHWAVERPRSTMVERYEHLAFDPSNGEDERYELRLKVTYWGCYIDPGDWLVFDGGSDDVLTDEQFQAEYEPIEVGA